MKKHGTKVRHVSSLSRNETQRNKRLSNKTVRRDGKRSTESSVLELWREKVGNSGNLNPREDRSERRCPTEKSDTAAARKRDSQRSYHSTTPMSSTFRHMWWQWL